MRETYPRLNELTRAVDINDRARSFTTRALLDPTEQDLTSGLAGRGVPQSHIAVFQRAAVGAMGIPTGELAPFGDAFLELVAPRSAFAAARFRRVPPDTRIGLEAPGADAGWVDESGPIPVSTVDIEFATVRLRKLGFIEAVTLEAARTPDAQSTIERALVRHVASGVDAAAFLPSDPGSLAYGATQVPAGGTPANHGSVVWDLLAQISGGVATRPFLVLGASVARAVFFGGGEVFRDVSLVGLGSIAGVPTFASTAPTLSPYIVAVDSDAIGVADGGIEMTRARSASLQMNSTPASDAQNLTSLFQSDAVAVRVLRYLGWARRDDAVAFAELALGSPS